MFLVIVYANGAEDRGFESRHPGQLELADYTLTRRRNQNIKIGGKLPMQNKVRKISDRYILI
jgi:hypothetical protein